MVAHMWCNETNRVFLKLNAKTINATENKFHNKHILTEHLYNITSYGNTARTFDPLV